MRKWSAAVDKQRKESLEEREISRAPSISAAPEFAWMQGQQMHNPYAEPDDDNDDDDEYPNLANSGPFSQQAHASQDYGGQHTFPGQGNFSMNRNASSTSLRSRSTTGESSQSLAGMARQPPPRFPMPPQQPLSLQTHVGQTAPSPGPHGGPGYQPDSYFSPVGESPASIASSRASQNSMYPFPRQGTPQGYDDQNRHTAPAMRAPSRGSQQSIIAAPPNGRNPQRPSLPPMSSQGNIRSRSYSTPDINAQLSQQRRKNELAGVPAVPGIPPHLHPAYDHGIPRSSNGSPINGALPVRAATQSPGVQRERMPSTSQPSGYQANVPPPYLRSNTAQIPHNRMDNRSEDYTMAPSAHGHQASTSSASANLNDLSLPTQLKVKVNCDGNYVTLVVAFNITYQSLIDRIDAKIGRFSNSAIAKGTMRLRYRDEDGDFVTIEGDEDIQVAFLEWREMEAAQGIAAGLGEIELFCAGVE